MTADEHRRQVWRELDVADAEQCALEDPDDWWRNDRQWSERQLRRLKAWAWREMDAADAAAELPR